MVAAPGWEVTLFLKHKPNCCRQRAVGLLELTSRGRAGAGTEVPNTRLRQGAEWTKGRRFWSNSLSSPPLRFTWGQPSLLAHQGLHSKGL